MSDLRELKSDSASFTNWQVVEDMIGNDPVKLAAQSPRLHAGEVKVPLLVRPLLTLTN